MAQATFRFVHRDFDRDGFTGKTSEIPIRFARVEIRDASTEQVLATGGTDGAGGFQIRVPDAQVRDVYAKVLTESADTVRFPVRVADFFSAANHKASSFSYDSPTLFQHDPAADVKLPTPIVAPLDRAAPAFNIMGVLDRGLEYIRAVSPGSSPFSPIEARWNRTRSLRASVYKGELSFPSLEAYDDLGILALESLTLRWVQVHPDTGGDNQGSEELTDAWTSGFGLFFALAERRWRLRGEDSWFVQLGPSPAWDHAPEKLDLARLTSTPRGADDPLSIARALWDLTGTNRTGLRVPDSTFWNCYENIPINEHSSLTVESWWTNWFAERRGHETELSEIFGQAGIRYIRDPHEPDDSLSAAPTALDGSESFHTLYPSGDRDWIRFHVRSGFLYDIRARSVRDGCTPELSLFQLQGDTLHLVAEDRRSSDSIANSRILYDCRQDGECWARCMAREGANLLGSYALSVRECSNGTGGYEIYYSAPRNLFLAGSLAIDPEGRIYGATTTYDGDSNTVFRLTPGRLRETLLTLPNSDGGPEQLATGSDGCIYGVTGPRAFLQAARGRRGQAAPGAIRGRPLATRGEGIIFRIRPDGEVRILHRFSGERDVPVWGRLGTSPDGWVYGATESGSDSGYGALFRVDSSGNFQELHVLRPIEGPVETGIVCGNDGSVYGTVRPDDLKPRTLLFRWDSARGFQILHEFTGYYFQVRNLVMARDGNLYMSIAPGCEGDACVLVSGEYAEFVRVDTAGVVTLLRKYGDADLGYPGGLIQGSDGRLYGTSFGAFFGGRASVFVLDSLGNYSVLHNFGDGSAGGTTFDVSWSLGLVWGSGGDLWGAGSEGGEFGKGGIFRMAGVGAAATAAICLPQMRFANGALTLSWSLARSGTFEFRVMRRELPDTGFVPIGEGVVSGIYPNSYSDRALRAGAAYQYRIDVRLDALSPWNSSPVLPWSAPAAGLTLEREGANPGPGPVRFSYQIREAGPVEASVFDASGRRIRRLWRGAASPGFGELTWDGMDAGASRAPSGIYFVRLGSSGETVTRRVVLIH